MFWLHERSRQLSSCATTSRRNPHQKESHGRDEVHHGMKNHRPPVGNVVSILVACWLAMTLSAVDAQSPANEPTQVPATAFPSWSIEPTLLPSSVTSTGDSTKIPTSIPSDMPSDVPSTTPTPEPSLEEESLATARFRQQFAIGNGRLFTETESVLFQGLYGSYTVAFSPSGVVVEDKIFTQCEFLTQKISNETLSGTARRQYHVRNRRLQQLTFLQVDFNMVYTSLYTNVSTFPLLFQSYVNAGLEQVAQQMQLLGLNVSEAFIASRIIIRPDPTVQPTSAPTLQPSVSHSPSEIPSDMPSLAPTLVSSPPTRAPSLRPTDVAKPTPSPAKSQDSSETIIISVVVAFTIVIIGLFVYYRRRKHHRDLTSQSNTTGIRKGTRDGTVWDFPAQKTSEYETGIPTETHNTISSLHRRTASGKSEPVLAEIISPSESVVSNQSLLSTGNSNTGDSGDEIDATHYLADEFDQYKDKDLEIVRAEVQENLAGCDDMMSQALTKAFIENGDSNIDLTELLWGGSGKLTGTEIEASALCEVTDWLKRNDAPTGEERYAVLNLTIAFTEQLTEHNFCALQTQVYARYAG